MPSELIKRAADYVKLKLYGEHTGHDWFHVMRVWEMVKRLAAEEGGDLNMEVLELGALLHDLGDSKMYEFDERKGSLILRGMMDVLDIDEDMQKKIINIISEAQYRGDETKIPQTLEGKILQDADLLDALGAIGVARTFATGGHIKRVIYDPKRKPRTRLSKEDYLYRKTDGTSINYFYEKTFKLPEMMNTKTGKALAKKRLEFLQDFIKEFEKEWEGKV